MVLKMRETVKENVLSDLKDGSEHTVNDLQDLLSNLSLKNEPSLEDLKSKNKCEEINEKSKKEDLTHGEEKSDDEKDSSNTKYLENSDKDESDQDDEKEDSSEECSDNEDSEGVGLENSDVEDLKAKFSVFELNDKKESDDDNESKEEEDDEEEEDDDDEDEEDEKTSYLKRGPMTEHRNQGYRFTPLQHASTLSHNSSLFSSPIHDSSSFFDVVEFPQYPSPDCVSQGNGLNQSFYENNEGICYNSCLSPESVHSTNSLSPFYSPNYSSGMTPNDYQFQSEISDSNFSLDFGNKGFDSYQPLSPPKSVSPVLKDGQDSSENLKESEDLINIIDSVNKSYNTNADGIPESELVKLRSALEGNEDSIRNEMGMYLKNDDPHFQSSINRSVVSSSEYTFNFEPPLTPPKSVSPVQENLSSESNSPYPEFQDCNDVGYPQQSDEHLIDILNGIDQINPEELNIYLNAETNAYDPSHARNIIHSRCKPNNLDHALRRLSTISAKYLCKKDSDGDTCLMIVYSKPEDSQDFYENIVCLQEKVKEIRLCCDIPLGKAKRCKVCGNSDPNKFYTPLSLKNKQGDTALSCAVKTDHSSVIINYLLDAILQCPEDFRRVFDEKGKAMLSDAAFKYPSLSQYL
ncbi:UNVERIFIED_CONTAM: hypothetical protein RMT77_000197 [Armadillidium vulgare]